MAPRKANKAKNNNPISLEMKISIKETVENFVNSLDECIEFPSTLTKLERAHIHEYIRPMGLLSRSRGSGKNRRLILYKRVHKISLIEWIIFTQDTRQYLTNYMEKTTESAATAEAAAAAAATTTTIAAMEATGAKKKRALPIAASFNHRHNNTLFHRNNLNGTQKSRSGLLALSNITEKLVPSRNNGSKYIAQERSELPIAQYKDAILNVIDKNRVIIINGDTGSGKTTQVPQYILEKCSSKGIPCRIICTQPRRMAAVAIAQRVAKERGERVGLTVGFQIRLESCLNKNTNLIYTTSGCVLRSLMHNISDTFRGLTHIIIDEIHERDKNTDFILITLRDQLQYNKHLKVILMSATMDINLLSNYFNTVPIINVPGRCYETRTFYLEDILYYTNYMTPLMQEYLEEFKQSKELYTEQKEHHETMASEVDENTQKFIDNIIEECISNIDGGGNNDDDNDADNNDRYTIEEHFDQLIYLIKSEGVPINACHSKLRKTPLILAAQLNNFEYLQKFTNLGANKYQTDSMNMNAFDYAAIYLDRKCLNFLKSHNSPGDGADYESLPSVSSIIEENEHFKRYKIHSAYRATFNDDEEIDHNLLITLIKTIIMGQCPGSILIFLPGYNDIVIQKDLINEQLPPLYKLFLLHSNMDVQDQQKVLEPCPLRKIILSTNIGETSITFPDVSYVIDAGKFKMNTYDSITGTSYLKSIWISQACANQRAGRAGRTQTGICYRLYSEERFEQLEKFATPEFLRIPLTEICLYAKAISRSSRISTYLSRALQPPSNISIYTAVNKLKVIGALDDDENITNLGLHLVEMPLEVQLGKCLIFAMIMKCLDPIITIVAFHSIKDPFILPAERSERGKASFRRKFFAAESFSDHMGIIIMYYQWRRCKSMGINYEWDFCTENYLTKASLDMMHAIQQQIYDHLRRKYQLSADDINYMNQNSDNWNLIQACLVAGLYPNICFVDHGRNRIASRLERYVAIHPSSALKPTGCKELKQYISQFNNTWIAFFEKTRTFSRANIRNNTLISSVIIALFCGIPLRKITISSMCSSPQDQQQQQYNDDDGDDDQQKDLQENKKKNSDDHDNAVDAAAGASAASAAVDAAAGAAHNTFPNNNHDDSDDEADDEGDDDEEAEEDDQNGAISTKHDDGKLVIDDWIEFYICQNDKILVNHLKQNINDVITEFLKYGKIIEKRKYDNLIETLDRLLKKELGEVRITDTCNAIRSSEDVMSNIGHFHSSRRNHKKR